MSEGELHHDLTAFRRRTIVFFVLFFLALGLLYVRLIDLQLVHGSEWRDLAENNRLRRLPVPGRRGRIYDRRGMVLAENRPSWQVLLFPDEARDLDRTGVFLARHRITEVRKFRDRLAERRIGRMAPLVVGENLDWEQVATLRAHQSDYPELSVVNRFQRHYPYGALAAHAVGHMRPISKAAVDADPGLEPDTMVGATGIEAAEQEFLADSYGEQWVMVSAAGRQLGVVREVAAVAGGDLGITLDIGLQQVAAEALGDQTGAVVALDPSNGAVRVLYSSPSFDPAVFGGILSRFEWQALQNDPLHPLQNRCLQGVYPPGSTIKPFLALAGLAEGLIDADRTVYCNGRVVLFGHPFRCWKRGGHGFVDLERSLAESCDVYYYLLGQKLGIEKMAAWLSRFGFGTPTGLDPTFESSGLVGTPEWSRRVRKTPWYPGEVVSVSIGQGPLLSTPVQLARGYAILANGGRNVTPHLVPGDAEATTGPWLNESHLTHVSRGLFEVVHGARGTARRLERFPIAGKTGTAQVARLQEGKRQEDLARELRHHALFVGWAPLEEPRLVVAVVVEHGGDGSSAAAPVAGRVIEAYLEQNGGGVTALPPEGTPRAARFDPR